MSLDNFFKKGLAYMEVKHPNGIPAKKVLMHHQGVYTLETGEMDSIYKFPGSQVILPETHFGYSLAEILHAAQKLALQTNAPVVIKPSDTDDFTATKPKNVYKGTVTLVALDSVEQCLTFDYKKQIA